MDKMVSIEDAELLICKALQNNGVVPQIATIVAKALVTAEIDGQKGHGFSRVASYSAQAKSGKVDGNALPAVKKNVRCERDCGCAQRLCLSCH